MDEASTAIPAPTDDRPPAFADVTESIATAGPPELRQAFILRREGGLPVKQLQVAVQGSRLQNFLPQH